MSNEQTKNPNALNKEGDPIIFDAIARMDMEQVRNLLEAGADIDKTGYGEQTPALRSAMANQWDICLYLLQEGADPTAADHVGITIPYLAFKARTLPDSYQGQFLEKVKKYLIEHDLEVLNIPPKQVRELQAAGAWPPEGTHGK